MKISCEKCSAPYEIEDTRIPPSGFIMKCPACLHSFKVSRLIPPPAAPPPQPAGAAHGLGTLPAPPGVGPNRYHVRRRTGKTFGPFVENAITTMLQNGKLDGDEQVSLDGTSWQPLSAVPAFARFAKAAGTPPARPPSPPPSPPLAPPPSPAPARPPSPPRPASALDDLPVAKGSGPAGIIDLPAPKRPVAPAKPAAPAAPVASAAPPPPAAPAAAPPERAPGPAGIIDLPAPKRPVGAMPGGALPGGIVDLPAPKGPVAAVPPPPPPPVRRPASPAPPAASPTGLGITDLPAPKRPAGPARPPAAAGNRPPALPAAASARPDGPIGIVDLPAPKGAAVPPPPPGGVVDLPTPKRAAGIVDLPTPKRSAEVVDLPAPKHASDGGLDDFDLAPASGQRDADGLDLGEVGLPAPKHAHEPPPPHEQDLLMPRYTPEEDTSGEAAIITEPGLPDMGNLDLLTPKSGASERAAQLHVDLDAVEAPASDGVLPEFPLGQPLGAPAYEAPPQPQEQAPTPARGSGKSAARVQPRPRPPEPVVARVPGRRRLVIALGALGALVLAGGAVGVFTLGVGAGGRIDAAALARLRAEIADDNYASYLRVGQRLKSAAQGNPKAVVERSMAAEALALAVIAHRGAAQHLTTASQLLAEIDRSNDSNSELIKARAAVAIASGKPQEAEARLTQLLGAGQKSAADALGTLLLGWAQLRGNRSQPAETSFQAAFKLDPKLAGAAYGMALCRQRANDPEGVRAWLQKALQAAPGHFAAGLWALTPGGSEDAIQGLIQAHGGKASPPELADAWGQIGQLQLLQERFDDAEASFKRALGADASSRAAEIGLGVTYYRLGRYPESRERLDSAHKADPNDVDAALALAKTELALGHPFATQELLEAAGKIAPQDARIKLVQGSLEESLDRPGAQERAAVLYKKAIDLDPKLVEAYEALAQQALRVGRSDQAQALASDATQAAGDTAPVHNLQGTVLLALAQPQKAMNEFRAALDKAPNSLSARFNLAAALEAQNKSEAALAELEKIRAKVPSYPGLSQKLGTLYQALGRTEDARKAYEDALKMPNATIPLKFAAASFFYTCKQCERAREVADQINNEDPRNGDAIELLAKIWECQGRMNEALQNIKHAIDVSDKPQYHLTRAKMLERLDKGQDALAEYEIAASRGHLPDAYVGRARLNLNFGANKEALHDLDLALKLDKTRADAYALQGRALLNLQQFKGAESKLQAATKIEPKDASAHYWLAEACAGANDFTCAGTHYREATRLGLSGEAQGDAYYKLGMYERSHGSQSGARAAFTKCIEVGTALQKTNCGRELQSLGGYKE